MNKQEIVSVLAELHKITGFRVSLHGANYEEIAAYPKEHIPFCVKVQSIEGQRSECVKCDREACSAALTKQDTHIYKCRFGITEAISPLYNFGTLTGFLMMGQVAASPEDAEQAKRMLEKLLDSTPEEECTNIPLVDRDFVEAYVNIMTLCARYLTISNAIPLVKSTVGEQAKKYIAENIDKKLIIPDICEALKCSKSTLLTSFKKQYGITVNAYITEVKLDMAVHLLNESSLTISEIASETGFSDQSYFSKVFSAKFGYPPSEYRLRSKAEKERIHI